MKSLIKKKRNFTFVNGANCSLLTYDFDAPSISEGVKKTKLFKFTSSTRIKRVVTVRGTREDECMS